MSSYNIVTADDEATVVAEYTPAPGLTSPAHTPGACRGVGEKT